MARSAMNVSSLHRFITFQLAFFLESYLTQEVAIHIDPNLLYCKWLFGYLSYSDNTQ